MIKFLVIEQDLRVSGTSQGIISRSFLAKLRMAYPESIIDVLYLKTYESEDQLDLLPVNSITSHIIKLKPPFHVKWINRISWRLFNYSMYDRFVHQSFAKYISQVDIDKYDHVFVRSAGLNHETILGTKDLPVLKKAIVNFHDPYPLYWYVGSKSELSGVELSRLQNMQNVVAQAQKCMSSANCMSKDMQFLYGSKKIFHSLPHQYDESVFDLSDVKDIYPKTKKVTISYHGAIQFGRNLDIVLDSYKELVEANKTFRDNTEFILRLKSSEFNRLKEKYQSIENIKILKSINFSNAAHEQKYIADINIILENGPLYCNILVGKAPFLAFTKKPILSISPLRSELRDIIKDGQFIAHMNDQQDIKQKLKALIENRLTSNEAVYPFGDYFSDENFKKSIDAILSA
ncbi:hypothetical protein [Algibacter sp. 2305UL17-15]|uniref:hypothetical protein n=1 Tax=Algibacter sp. 2305UL17-15 TaxID=3231268 RepID=UPI003458CEC9